MRFYLFVIVLLFFYSGKLYCQLKVVNKDNVSNLTTNKTDLNVEESTEKIFISYDEKLKHADLSISEIDEYSWEITNNDSYRINGIGRQILDVKFEKPGDYDIVLSHTEKTNTKACNHGSESILYRLKVLDSKCEFLFDELTLSNSIVGNIECKGIILSVPVIYSNYYNTPGSIFGMKMVSSGVNTSITGEIDNKHTPLQVGKNLISFNLIGKATSNTYIMFDFYNQDNLIQTYYLPNVIK